MKEDLSEYVREVEVLRGSLGVEKIAGIGEFSEERKDLPGRAGEDWYYLAPNGKVFLVVRAKTIEVRCDAKLSGVLREKYESVMESRYFGRGGVEIVPSGQLEGDELEDLIRLSYNLTKEMDE